jgi:hypothetical protein
MPDPFKTRIAFKPTFQIQIPFPITLETLTAFKPTFQIPIPIYSKSELP